MNVSGTVIADSFITQGGLNGGSNSNVTTTYVFASGINVGSGNTSVPSYTLQVAGTGYVSGNTSLVGKIYAGTSAFNYLGSPTSSTYDGERVVVYKSTTGTVSSNLSIGVETNYMWFNVGSGDGYKFYSAASTTPRMMINTSGYVGINTTSVSYQFEVIGDSRLYGNLYLGNPNTSGSDVMQVWCKNVSFSNYVTVGSLTAYASSNYPLYVNGSAYVTGSAYVAGYVGVNGVAGSSSYPLNVSGNAYVSGALYTTRGNGGIAAPAVSSLGERLILFDLSSGANNFAIGVESEHMWFNVNYLNGYKWYAGGSAYPKMTLSKTDGYLGINTTTPTYPLTVNGSTYIAGYLGVNGVAGSASYPLNVNGSAYVSGYLGVNGVAGSASYPLNVSGSAYVSGYLGVGGVAGSASYPLNVSGSAYVSNTVTTANINVGTLLKGIYHYTGTSTSVAASAYGTTTFTHSFGTTNYSCFPTLIAGNVNNVTIYGVTDIATNTVTVTVKNGSTGGAQAFTLAVLLIKW
jgi:hypothetical protein